MWTMQKNKQLLQIREFLKPYWDKLEDNESLLWAVGGFVGSIIAASSLRYLAQNGPRILEELRVFWESIDPAFGLEGIRKLLPSKIGEIKSQKQFTKVSKTTHEMTRSEELHVEDPGVELGEGIFGDAEQLGYDLNCEDASNCSGQPRLFPRLPLELEEKIRKIQETKLKIKMVKTGSFRKSRSDFHEDSAKVGNVGRIRDPESMGDTTQDISEAENITEQVYAMTDSSITPNPTITPTALISRSQQMSSRSLQRSEENTFDQQYGSEVDTYAEEMAMGNQRYGQPSSPNFPNLNLYTNAFQPIERYEAIQNFNPQVYEPQPQQFNQGYPNVAEGDFGGTREPKVLINKLPPQRYPHYNQEPQKYVSEDVYPTRRIMEPTTLPTPVAPALSHATTCHSNVNHTHAPPRSIQSKMTTSRAAPSKQRSKSKPKLMRDEIPLRSRQSNRYYKN